MSHLSSLPPCMYGKVDQERCIACGICQLKAPALFDYDDEAIAYMTHDANSGTQPIPEAQLAAFRDAYTHCPTGAIVRSQQPFDMPH